MIWIIGHFLAVGIGVSLGLLGGGGSVLALPVLVYVMGVAPKPAIAMTLIIVGTVSLLGSIPHARRGNLNLKTAVIFGTATMLGAYLGARIATLPFITSAFQMTLFGLSMLIAAGLMIYRTSKSKPVSSQDELDAIEYVKPVCKYCWLWLMTEGIAVGILTGLVGVGGGFAIVPALVLLGNIPMRQAIGTSLLIIACNSVAGLLGYLGHISLDWNLTVSFTFLAGCGTVIGAYLAQFIPAQQLQKSFGYFLLVVATFVLVQNRDSLQGLKKSSAQQQPHNALSADGWDISAVMPR
ncbi:sulfite exporter TauE/SafE family protein [Tychonema sp. LEGE 07203]|uniref:sulfite exporter TauE/SafE family protein n=1 Tax=Tychonema sp. LEGE 07203 TaxID=1828671 RepID=UPI0018815B13|nr:sulfite exporter TauE/SafE family protein [Tychonema sp. LEGE 07203]MBE9096365.1 sulfite exporter TauE/SafE family protein [Tychonema sp. LEGE 07203]